MLFQDRAQESSFLIWEGEDLFVYSFSTCALSEYYIPGCVLSTGNAVRLVGNCVSPEALAGTQICKLSVYTCMWGRLDNQK